MKKWLKRTAKISLVLFVLIQFYQPARNINTGGQVAELSFHNTTFVPDSVDKILRVACYDCHSNNTQYPWYSYIQPVRSLMDYHIYKGKENLNFDEFGNYSKHKQRSKLKSMAKQVKEGDMPLTSYTMMHSDAQLTNEQKTKIINWINKYTNNEEN